MGQKKFNKRIPGHNLLIPRQIGQSDRVHIIPQGRETGSRDWSTVLVNENWYAGAMVSSFICCN
jgi:hypothetical protein